MRGRRSERRVLPLLPIGTGVTAAAAIGCLGARGLLPRPVAVLAMALTAAAGWLLVRWPTGRGAVLRRSVAQPVAAAGMVLTPALLLVRIRAADGDPAQLVSGIGTSMAYPLVLILVAQLGSAGSLRDLGVVLLGSLMCALLALGTVPDATTPDLTSALGSFLGLGWAAGLVTLWLIHRGTERARAPRYLGGRGPDSRQPLLLVLVPALVGLMALLLPHPAGIHPGGAGQRTDGGARASGGGAPDARGLQNYLSPGMDLDARGELPRTRLVEVPADSPALWASTVMVDYTGRAWGPGEEITTLSRVPRDAAGAYDLRRGAVPGLPPGPADRTDAVRPLLSGRYLPLLAPGQPVSVLSDNEVGAAGSSMFYPAGPGGPYVIRSTGTVVGPVTPADTDLPTSVPDRVRDLAGRLTLGAETVEAKVSAIESYLRAHQRYRLDSPVPDADEDAVDDFLFESHEGFCEHFASAEAVLLRAVGVPARLVTGFAGGSRSGTGRILRGSDAHAWVQVHVGDGRWMWSDPTAGATLAEDRPGVASRVLDLLRSHAVLLVTVALGAAAATVTTLLAVRRGRSRRATARALAAPLEARALAAFAALERALAGTPLARPPQTSVLELRRLLLDRWPGGLPDAERVSAAFALVQRVLYAGSPVGADEALGALAALERLTEQAVGVRAGGRQKVRTGRGA